MIEKRNQGKRKEGYKKCLKKTNGITLTALVVTIVVLLILAGVSISILAGDNGIITQAQSAKENTRGGDVKDRVTLAALENITTNYAEGTKITKEDMVKKLEEEGKLKPSEAEKLQTEDIITIGNIEIDFGILKGTNSDTNDSDKNLISESENYIGYYANIDGTVGIIYADLAHDKKGTWNKDNWSNYQYSKKENLRSYSVSTKDYEGIFGNKPIITQVENTEGNDRFYVMALEDFKLDSLERFYWYYNAKGKLKRPVEYYVNDFEQGKQNTIDMINAWGNNEYGEQTTADSKKEYIDIWGAIQDERNTKYPIVQTKDDSEKWFIPSKSEWAAFGDYLYTELGMTKLNYNLDYNLNDLYWSSSQRKTEFAYTAFFISGYIGSHSVNDGHWVRLSATF